MMYRTMQFPDGTATLAVGYRAARNEVATELKTVDMRGLVIGCLRDTSTSTILP
jgi:hypothetical protein